MNNHKIVCWWSGGVTSAVACKVASDIWGVESCTFLMIDTGNESQDTYRFRKDCEAWYGKEIHRIGHVGPGKKYKDIQEVWEKFNSLNVAHGAICSSELKLEVRKQFERENEYIHQVFGFDITEGKRAKAMALNYPKSKPLFPLLLYGYTKKDCIRMIEKEGIKIPEMYQLGFHNNNCFGTGCVQGGIGYWQKMRAMFPEKFKAMADMEHRLTDKAGKPVTCNKDQSDEAKQTGQFHVFLLPHPDYPEYKDISQIKGRPPKPLVECNGFCGTYDLTTPKERQELTLF